MKKFNMSDAEIACNMIKTSREYGRRSRVSKTINIPLFKEDNYIVYSTFTAGYNKLTKCYPNPSFCIKWKCKSIYPTTNQKLKCINKRGLEYLEQSRTYTALRNLKRKRKLIKKHPNLITFTNTFESGIYFTEYIKYNLYNGNVIYSSRFVLKK